MYAGKYHTYHIRNPDEFDMIMQTLVVQTSEQLTPLREYVSPVVCICISPEPDPRISVFFLYILMVSDA